VTGIAPYASNPVRLAATLALNSRSGGPIVEIRCACPYRRGNCGRPLGGAYATPHGTVVILNRLQRHDTVRQYQRIGRRPENRERAWNETGFTPEEPVLVKLGGEWLVVPGEDHQPTVRCPRHGAWTLDRDAELRKIAEAQVSRAKQTYGTSRPA